MSEKMRTSDTTRKPLEELHPRALKSRDLRDLDRGHKDTPGDTFWLAGIYFLGPVTFEFLLGFESMVLL